MKWSVVPIGKVCLETGQRDPGSKPDTQFRYVDLSTIDRESKRIVSAAEIKGIHAPSRARKEIRTGDVLVSTVRPNLNAVATVPEDLDGEIASTGLCVLRADRNHVHPRFLFYRVRCDDFVQFLVDRVTGANYPAVSDRVVKAAPLLLPPLDEQERIVRILDEAENLWKLRVQADRRTADLIPALFQDMFGDPVTNTQGWDAKELGEMCAVRGGGTPSKAQPEFWEGDIPWVSPKDMTGPVISDAQDHITAKALEDSATNLIPAGAILIVTRSGILRHSLPVALTLKSVAINQDIKAFIPKQSVDPVFLLSQFQNRSLQILSMVRAGATVQNLETDSLKRMPFVIPSFSLQREFAARVAEIRALETEQATSRRRLDDLFQSLLDRAFRGEL